jgi:hypothetical protein
MKLSSTRQAIHDALAWGWQQGESSMVQYLTYLTRIEKSIRSSEPCGDFLEAAFICAAINMLGTEGGWLKFAYGHEDSPIIQTDLGWHLLYPLGATTAKRHRRMLSLAMTTLEDYRMGYWQEKQIPVQLYAERMGVYPDNFERDWGEIRRLMFKQIMRWDREGVGQVGRMVHALKGPNDPEDRPSKVLEDITGK